MDSQADVANAWFDMGRIKQLVKLMKDNDLSEIDLEWEKSRIRLRRGAAMIASAPMPAYASSTGGDGTGRLERRSRQ